MLWLLLGCGLSERLRLPPRLVRGRGDAGRVLCDGPAVVRGRHCAFYLSREQLEAGVWVLCTRRAAQVPGHPWAALYWAHDLHPDGLLCFYDLCVEGQQNKQLNACCVNMDTTQFTRLPFSSSSRCLCFMECFSTWGRLHSEASRWVWEVFPAFFVLTMWIQWTTYNLTPIGHIFFSDCSSPPKHYYLDQWFSKGGTRAPSSGTGTRKNHGPSFS